MISQVRLQRRAGADPGYERLRMVRRYLKWVDDACTEPLPRLAQACGYRNVNKFQRRRSEWARGAKAIPIAWIDAIGVDRHALEAALDVDQQNYDRAMAALSLPRHWIVRLLPAVYVTYPLAEDISTYAAWQHVQEAVDGKPELRAYLHWPGLTTTCFRDGRPPATTYYRPEIRGGGIPQLWK